MRTKALLVSAAFIAAIAVTGALPARADVHQLGAVNVPVDHYAHVSWSRFEGPVARLRFIATNDAIDCEHVLVTYRDGTVHDVFSGLMPENSVETITFTEGDSRIRNVDFACKAMRMDGARIALSAVSEGPEWADPDEDMARPAHVRAHVVPAARFD
jgi:hypothetical protein